MRFPRTLSCEKGAGAKIRNLRFKLPRLDRTQQAKLKEIVSIDYFPAISVHVQVDAKNRGVVFVD